MLNILTITTSNTAQAKLFSDSFSQGSSIPSQYTCDGTNKIPHLKWEPVKGAKSYVLIVDDPDAPKKFLNGQDAFVHWVVYDISPQVDEIKAGSKDLPGIQGTNSAGKQQFMGPCPPDGTHRYYFKLYALDIETLGLNPGATKQEVLHALQGHLIEETQLMGTYTRIAH